MKSAMKAGISGHIWNVRELLETAWGDTISLMTLDELKKWQDKQSGLADFAPLLSTIIRIRDHG